MAILLRERLMYGMKIAEGVKSYSKFTKLYAAYRHLETDQEPRNKAYNKKLLDLLGENLIKVFRHVDQAMGPDPDPKLFEETVSKLLHEPIHEGIPVFTPDAAEDEKGGENEPEGNASLLDLSKQNLLDMSKQAIEQSN